jgi:hypothetical protein
MSMCMGGTPPSLASKTFFGVGDLLTQTGCPQTRETRLSNCSMRGASTSPSESA